MAVDETLLKSALDRGVAAIRLYEWSAPTVSLGYFQDADEFERDGQFAGLAAVRRLSGGGAILHDREVTYSITLPPSHPLTAHPSQLYRLAHNAIIRVLANYSVTARMRGDVSHQPEAPARAPGDSAESPSLALRASDSTAIRPSINHQPSTINPPPDPFLCFGRGDPNDIVLGSHKIVGSAQRRRRGAILQHGSLLLERSPHAPDFPGLHELTGIHLDRAALAAELGAAIAAVMDATCTAVTLSATELNRAAELQSTRYHTLRWRPRHDTSLTSDQ